jgi:acyl-coenzyme A synthetase/AMP-(fatty) acid ligase
VVVSEPVEAKELVRHCRSELAPFKVPARFIVVDALPRNANGKVVKAVLLESL